MRRSTTTPERFMKGVIIMASYNIKHIEYLRQKANLTYEQAVALLDRNDGDIGKALIELERSGALYGEAAYRGSARESSAAYGEQTESRGKSFWDTAVELFIKSLRIKLVIEKSSETIARLPVIYLLVAACMAPHLAMLSIVLMFLTGCRVHIERAHNPEGDRRIRDYARGAEQTVRSKMGGSSAQRRTPYNAPKSKDGDKGGDDYDSFTVE